MNEAHRLSQGAGITIAILDSGVDGNHLDLAGNVVAGYNVTPGSKDDGWTDLTGHGTGMAGIICGHGHGRDGALGIAPRASVVPIKGIGSDLDSANTSAQGIDLALEHGARIISISANTNSSAPLERAVRNAVNRGVIIVAAVGNSPSVATEFPARYPGVLAVGATDKEGMHADFSVPGPEVMLAAPGEDIVSTYPGDRYASGSGTSSATAIVAGAVALVRAKYPNLSAPEVIHRLTATATDKGPPGRDDQYGYGIVNIVAALTADVPPLASSDAPSTNPQATSGDSTGTAIHAGLLLAIGLAVVIVGAVLLVILVLRQRHDP